MHICEGDPTYLSLSLVEQSYAVAFHFDLSEVMKGWRHTTRVSPIWEVGTGSISGINDRTPPPFEGRQYLVFVGPCAPSAAFAAVDPSVIQKRWVTVGAFNNIALISGKSGESSVAQLLQTQQSENLPIEVWPLIDGVFDEPQIGELSAVETTKLAKDLSTFAENTFVPTLLSGVQEYCCLMASCVARAARVRPQFLKDLELTHESVKEIVPVGATPAKTAVVAARANLTSINAALSRFSSQTFSGISPIAGTECHFWTHSLLGTGTANIALANVVRFVEQTLGQNRLPQLMESYRNAPDGPSYTRLKKDNSLLTAFNEKIGSLVDNKAPLVPLITYFSGRYGFSRHLQTVSAPLSTVVEANSYRSSLLTITHEICHVVTDGILSELYPDLIVEEADAEVGKAVGISEAKRLLGMPPADPCSNVFESAQRLLFESIISMEIAHRDPKEHDWEVTSNDIDDEEKLAVYFRRWRKEAQEIIVHTLDYVYFYQSATDYYVYSIWHSWCSIHDIQNRIPEYIRRTISAISFNLIDKPVYEVITIASDAVKNSLEKLIEQDIEGVELAAEALDYLNAKIDSEQFKAEISARLMLVRHVSIFMYSENLAAEINSDPYIASKSKAAPDSDYENIPLSLEHKPLANPVRFIKSYSEEETTQVYSLWLLLSLAFGCDHGKNIE